MQLMEASKQWALRPPDERFDSLAQMYAQAQQQRQISQSIKLPESASLQIGYDALDEELNLEVSGIGHFALNNWTLSQLCNRAQAPADYLIGLDDPELLATCLNRSMFKQAHSPDVNSRRAGTQLYHQDGTLRAITSNRYSRIYDCDILQRLLPLNEAGWKTPPAWGGPNSPGARQATAKDVVNYSLVKLGDWIRPSGLYRGDRDMFVFLINDENRINDGSDLGLGRGFFVRNSEVGCASFSYTEFAYRYVCGNHIVWGAQDVREVRLRHIGADTPEKAFQALTCQLVEYANSSTETDELLIKRSKEFVLGANKNEVLDFLFGKRLLTRKLAGEAYDLCERFEDKLNPRSIWGIVQGVTRASQEQVYADKRNQVDELTPKLLKLVA